MFVVDPLLAFAGVSALVIMTPGPDTAVTISGTLSRGRRGGVFTALGVFCGQVAWTLAASAGISALLVASEPAFLVVKYAGATYLAFLGLQALWTAVRHKPADHQLDGDRSSHRQGGLACFRRGLLSDLGNPKMAVFFTGLLPQFGSRFTVLALLGLAFCAMTLGWLCCYALVVARMGDLLGRSAVRRALDAVTGSVLVAFGARLAVERG
jgi:threonine/homoserine/homoserine lactone efflux protein